MDHREMSGIFLRKGYLDSARVARLSPPAERFYVHLLLITPDCGVFEVDYELLLKRCFPNINMISAFDIRDWLTECINADLIRIEKVDGAKFIIRVLRHQPKVEPEKTPTENNVQTAGTCFSFNEFWQMYGRKVEKRKCEMRYAKISEADRKKIKEFLPAYIAATPDLKFRKYPATWLNNRGWEDDISAVSAENNGKPGKTEGF
jgi:hypothetical protein